MATYIENQPVLFTEAPIVGCSCDEFDFEQAVHLTDVTQFQLINECFEDTNVIIDPEMTGKIAGWTIDDADAWEFDLILCSALDFMGSIHNDFVFTNGSYYKIVVVVDSINEGGSVMVSLGATILGYITASGTHTFYGFAVDVAGFSYLIYTTEDLVTQCCISQTNGYEMLINNVVNILDEDNLIVAVVDYVSTPEYFDFDGDKITVSINWADLGITSGCHHLCWLDACSNNQNQNYAPTISNCEFLEGATDWTLGSLWSLSGADMIGVAGAGPYSVFNRSLSQADVFPFISVSYSVTIIVSAFTSGTCGVYFGTTLIGNITAAGTFVFSGYCEANTTLTLVLSNKTTLTIDSICPTVAEPSENVCDLVSNTFVVKDFSSVCTMDIKITNIGTAFGFDYTNFNPHVRIDAKLRQSSYKGERLTYKDSKGNRRVVSYDATKYKNLATGQLPEYLHDFLRLGIGADVVSIDGTEYYFDDEEYLIVRDNIQDEFGYVNILVAKNNQNVKNINCESAETDGGCNENNLLLEDNELIIL